MIALRAVVASTAIVLSASASFAQGSPSGPTPDAAGETGPTAAPTTEARKAAEARGAFEEGLRLLRAERWPDAEAQFRRSLDCAPRASARYDLAFVLYKQGRARESSRILQAMLADGDEPLAPHYREYAQALLERVLGAPSMAGVGADRGAGDPRMGDEPTAPRAVEPAPVDAETLGREAAPAVGQAVASDARADRGRVGGVARRGAEAWVLWGATAVLATGTIVSGVLALQAKSDLASRLDTFPGNADDIERARAHAKTLAVVTDAFAGATLVAGALGLYVSLSGHRRGAGQPGVIATFAPSGVQLRGWY